MRRILLLSSAMLVSLACTSMEVQTTEHPEPTLQEELFIMSSRHNDLIEMNGCNHQDSKDFEEIKSSKDKNQVMRFSGYLKWKTLKLIQAEGSEEITDKVKNFTFNSSKDYSRE